MDSEENSMACCSWLVGMVKVMREFLTLKCIGHRLFTHSLLLYTSPYNWSVYYTEKPLEQAQPNWLV